MGAFFGVGWVMSNVIPINCVTRLDIDPDIVLDAAKKLNLTDVVIMGYYPDGSEYFASSVADGGTVLWMMERSKKLLMEVFDDQNDD